MDERLKQIAEALETQNDLFREWIDLNRSSIEQNMKMRAEYFPLEMEKARLDIAMQKSFTKDIGELGDTLDKTIAAVGDITAKIPAATTPKGGGG